MAAPQGLGRLSGRTFYWWWRFLDSPIAHVPTMSRIFTGVKVLGKYLALLLFPTRFSADYSCNQIPPPTPLFEPRAIWVVLAILGVLAYSF